MSEDQFRELFSRPDHTTEPPLPDGFATSSLDRARRRVRTHRRSRLAVGGIAVVAVAAVTAGVVAAGGPAARTTQQRQRTVAAPGSAQVLLGRVSLAADDQTVTVRDDQFIYSDILSTYTFTPPKNDSSAKPALPPQHDQLWASVDGSRPGRAVGPGKDRATAVGTKASISDPNYHFMETLPADPDKLLAMLRAQLGAEYKKSVPVDDALWDSLTILVNQPVLPPKLAAAVYQAAARVPGVTLDKDVTDAAGRHGIAVSRTGYDGARTSWIFDPKTYQYLGERQVSQQDSDVTAVLGRGVVDQVGQLPR